MKLSTYAIAAAIVTGCAVIGIKITNVAKAKTARFKLDGITVVAMTADEDDQKEMKAETAHYLSDPGLSKVMEVPLIADGRTYYYRCDADGMTVLLSDKAENLTASEFNPTIKVYDGIGRFMYMQTSWPRSLLMITHLKGLRTLLNSCRPPKPPAEKKAPGK